MSHMRQRRLTRLAVACLMSVCAVRTDVFTGAGGSHSAAPDALVIVVPSAYQTYQRDGSGVADLPVSGTYDARGATTTAAIEARFNGGAWRVIDPAPASGLFRGTLPAQTAGQGALEVRFANSPDVTARVPRVGIGDVMVGAGDSRAAGRGTRAQISTHRSLVATRYAGDWDAGDDRGPSAGTIYPLVATLHMARHGVPLATITTGVGSTDLAGHRTEWDPDGDASAYDAMVAAVAASGVNAVRWVHFMGGPNAIVSPRTPTQQEIEAALRRFVARVSVDLPGAPAVVVDVFGECGTGAPPDRRRAQDNYRQAVIALANEGVLRLGAVLVGQDYADDVHPQSDAELRVGAGRAWAAFHDAISGGDQGRGPRLLSAALDGTASRITVDVDRDLAAGTAFGGFRVEEDGEAVPASAMRRSARRIRVALDRAVRDDSRVTVAFASNDDAAGATVPASRSVALPDGSSVMLPMEPARVQVMASRRGALRESPRAPAKKSPAPCESCLDIPRTGLRSRPFAGSSSSGGTTTTPSSAPIRGGRGRGIRTGTTRSTTSAHTCACG